jgi:hypothetical protein
MEPRRCCRWIQEGSRKMIGFLFKKNIYQGRADGFSVQVPVLSAVTVPEPVQPWYCRTVKYQGCTTLYQKGWYRPGEKLSCIRWKAPLSITALTTSTSHALKLRAMLLELLCEGMLSFQTVSALSLSPTPLSLSRELQRDKYVYFFSV